jgi:hypothetical protein
VGCAARRNLSLIAICSAVPESLVIDPFDQANEALAYLEKGRAKGKVAVQIR